MKAIFLPNVICFIFPRLSSDAGENMNDYFWKIHFYDNVEKPLFICTRYGGIRDEATFQRVFGKISLS